MKKAKDEFERKRALRRKKIRRRRLIIGFFTFMIFSAAVFAVLSVTVLFPVKTVNAGGKTRYSAEEIIKASGLSEKNNIFTFSSEKTAEKIRKKLPYAGEISVTRKLPDTVDIKIKTELSEFAYIHQNDGYYAVSSDFKVLNFYAERPERLFAINCSGVGCEVGENVDFSKCKNADSLKSLINELAANEIQINAVNSADSGVLSAVVCGRFKVNFGTAVDIRGKAAHLAGMIKAIEPDKTGRIDLSMWNSSASEGTFIAGAIDLNSEIEPNTAG